MNQTLEIKCCSYIVYREKESTWGIFLPFRLFTLDHKILLLVLNRYFEIQSGVKR